MGFVPLSAAEEDPERFEAGGRLLRVFGGKRLCLRDRQSWDRPITTRSTRRSCRDSRKKFGLRGWWYSSLTPGKPPCSVNKVKNPARLPLVSNRVSLLVALKLLYLY